MCAGGQAGLGRQRSFRGRVVGGHLAVLSKNSWHNGSVDPVLEGRPILV